MLSTVTPRSWLYTPMIRPLYTTSITHAQLRLTQVPKRRFTVPKISTLRPEKLVHSDFLVLAGKPHTSFHTQLSLRTPEIRAANRLSTSPNYHLVDCPNGTKHDIESEGVGGIRSEVEIKSDGVKRKKRVHVPFPGYAQGFLYLHQPQPGSDLPRLASSVRFRCVPPLAEASSSYVTSLKLDKMSTPHSKPSILLPPSFTHPEIYEAFKSGYDLTHLNGLPWSIPIILVAGRPALKYVRMQLLEDRLFSEGELQEYEEIYKSTNFGFVRRMNLLYTLEDMFSVRFDKHGFMVRTMVTKDKAMDSQAIPGRGKAGFELKQVQFKRVFMDLRSEHRGALPYTGAAHVRFEIAPSSDPSKPTLCLRIIKITEPVECVIPDYDGYVHMPKEGELVARGLPGRSGPWICRLKPSVPMHSAMLRLVPGYTANADLC